jgi:hypothetical protein
MRYYPFGSSSLNPIYNTSAVTTASISNYALTASYATRVVTASVALNGAPGVNGIDGQCIYLQGPTGSQGDSGNTGIAGGVSVPLGPL